MHRQLFSLMAAAETRSSSWEPPIDVLETDDEVLIIVALPAVDPEAVHAVVTIRIW
jgi:HSP20 family protein